MDINLSIQRINLRLCRVVWKNRKLATFFKEAQFCQYMGQSDKITMIYKVCIKSQSKTKCQFFGGKKITVNRGITCEIKSLKWHYVTPQLHTAIGDWLVVFLAKLWSKPMTTYLTPISPISHLFSTYQLLLGKDKFHRWKITDWDF
jgi:hypothetical protein